MQVLPLPLNQGGNGRVSNFRSLCLFHVACFTLKCLVFLQLNSFPYEPDEIGSSEILGQPVVPTFSAVCELWFKIRVRNNLHPDRMCLDLFPLSKKPVQSK